MKKLMLAVLAALAVAACRTKEENNVITLSGLKVKDFMTEVNGKNTSLFVLTNARGVEACITNYGGRLVSLLVPDRNGDLRDVVLGYDNIADYLASDGNYGALIGRYGNRIRDGRFTLDGKEYQLPQNNFGHCLHGGPDGYHVQVWDARQIDKQTLQLAYLSKDGDAGFPGNLAMTVTYRLADDNSVDIQYQATTDKPTIVNLTNHSYFNLSGKPGSQITDHYIYIDADSFTGVDETLIPVALTPVEGTVMDLRRPTIILNGIDDEYDQIVLGKGYDHNWVLNTGGDLSRLAAKAYHDGSGIVLDVYTNEPGIQFYSGNFMPPADKGKRGVTYPHRGALCLETQHYPDSPNQPAFPSVTLRPGEKYDSRCIYRFKTVPTPVTK